MMKQPDWDMGTSCYKSNMVKILSSLRLDFHSLYTFYRRVQGYLCRGLFVFVKERIHNAVELDIIGIFGCVFIVTNLPSPPPPPPEKLFRGYLLAFHKIGLA